MQTFNFRLYGEYIYGLLSKYLTEYINPKINKEEFIFDFKNGILNLHIDKLNKPINILPLLSIKNANVKSFQINIPDERTNFIVKLNKLKLVCVINDNQIESFITEERKKLIENFIRETINKILKKENNKTFLHIGLFDSLKKKALDRLVVELNEIGIYFRFYNYSLVLKINKIIYNEKDGIKIQNINLIYENLKNLKNKTDIIKEFNIGITIDHNKEKDNINNLKVDVSDLYFEINRHIYTAIIQLINKFNDISYKKRYIRYKKLIVFKKPIKNNNKKLYYSQLWFWAIKAVIKLQKYKAQKKLFDSLKSMNSNLIKENINNENNNNIINNYLILPEEIVLLESTKEQVENKILENKKNKLFNKFQSFLNEGEDNNQIELTEKEKLALNNAYTRENIINFILKRKNEDNIINIKEEENKKEEAIFNKLKIFINNISLNVTLNKIEILLNYFHSSHSIYVKNIDAFIDLSKQEKNSSYQIIIQDIGYDSKNSFINNIIKENEVIKFIKNYDDIYEFSFGFKNLMINNYLILYLINFYYSLYYTNINKENENIIFINQEYNQAKNNKKIFHIINNIKINNLPTLNIIDNKSKICLSMNIFNFTINTISISFNLNIKDNNSNIIINNYEIKIKKNEENTKFDLTLNKELIINSPSKITEYIYIFFMKIKKLKQFYILNSLYNNNNNNNNNNKNELLYQFKYQKNKKLNIENDFLNKLDIKISINNLSLEINEENGKTNITLVNLILTYNKEKNLLFKLESLDILLNKNPLILSLINVKLKKYNFKNYEVYILKEIKNDFNLDNIKDLLLLNENIYNKEINDYSCIKSQFFDLFKVIIKDIKISYINENNIFSLFFNNILGENENNLFHFVSQKTEINYKNTIIGKKNINIMDLKENFFLCYNYIQKKFEINIKNLKFILNAEKIKLFKEKIDLRIDREIIEKFFKNFEIIINILNTYIIFDKFNFNIPKIEFKNYDNNKKDKIIVKFEPILMKSNNNSRINLLEEKSIKLIYLFEHKANRSLNIETTSLNIMLSQDDLNLIITTISYIYFKLQNPLNNNENNNGIDYINIDYKIPQIKLFLCENITYRKIGELYISSTKFFINTFNKENKNFVNNYIEQIQYTVLINQILLKYIDMNNNEIILLKSGKDENKNNIELFCSNNNIISINLNYNSIILRGDSFYSFYIYFKKAIPLNEIKEMMENTINKRFSKIIELKYNLNFTEILIPSTFNAKENISFNLENLVILFNSLNDSVFPIGIFKVDLYSISSIISYNNIKRKFFYTINKFLSVEFNLDKNNLNSQVNLDTLNINLAYTDIILILHIYYLNSFLIEEKMKILYPNNNNINYNDNNLVDNIISFYFHYLKKFINQQIIDKIILFSGAFTFENFNITLIDNSTGSYYPFIQLKLENINLICDTDNKINAYFFMQLNSYNYKALVWEPSIEKFYMRFKHREYNDNNIKNREFYMKIDNMNINLSDMSISFTLKALSNWIIKLLKDKKNYKNIGNNMLKDNSINFNNINPEINLTKITNNKIINYTGIRLTIIYANNILYCDPFSEIELEYINEWDIEIYGPKQISLSLDSNIFYIPIERICTRMHKINNNLYIVSENILSKDRQMNIYIYSPIIFKNKSSYQLKINIFNHNRGNTNYLLRQNSCIGLPLNYYDPNTYFNINLNNNNFNINNIDYSLKEIIDLNINNNYLKNINLDSRFLLMSVSRKIPKVKTIMINCEYVICNCLPCNICIKAENNDYIVEKCSQQDLNFSQGNDTEIVLEIYLNNTTFSSKPKKLFQKVPKTKGNTLKFKNNINNECFRVSLLIKNKIHKKIIILYAESIFENESGVDFYFNSENTIFFKVSKNLYLISSKLDIKESKFTINNDFFNYISKIITLSDIINSNPCYNLNLIYKNEKTYTFNEVHLIIQKSLSYINLNNSTNKYNIISIIYRAFPSYKITNLLSTKNLRISCEEDPEKHIDIPPLNQINFDFFHKGININIIFSINNINENNGQFSHGFLLNKIGSYNFNLGKNMFNLEIKKTLNHEYIDVFVAEANFDNAQIIIDNKTDNIFNIYQKDYKSYNQIIPSFNKQILNIYEQNSMKFYFEYGLGYEDYFEFIPSCIQDKKKNLENNIIMCLESNGIKMKVSFYNKNIIEKNVDILEKYLFGAKINEILISIIGDNEIKNKKIRNYQRYEILLAEMNNLTFELKWDRNIGLIKKDNFITNFSLQNLNIYNQMDKKTKFLLVFKNSKTPFIKLNNTIYHFQDDDVLKINTFSLFLSDIKLNLEFLFIAEIIDWVLNINNKMKINNYQVDKLFLKEDKILNDYQNEINEYFETYNKKGLIFYGNNLSVPQIKLDLIISNNGLDYLKDKFHLSSLYILCINRIIDKKLCVQIRPYTINVYKEYIQGIGKIIWNHYLNDAISKLISLGISNALNDVLDKFKTVFSFGLFDSNIKKNNNIIFDEEQFNRKRLPRAFYEKFKYFKEFNKEHAMYLDLIQQKFNSIKMQFIFNNLVKEKNNIFVFTNISLLMITNEFDIYNTFDYFYIENVN